MTALISVVIPTHNRASLLPRAIGSVLKQSYPHFELLVVDDGSTDDSAALIKTLADPRLRYIHQRQAGVSAARNAGARAAQGDWLAFLDSDDEWLPQKLAKQWDFHQQHPQLLISQTEDSWIRHGRPVRPQKIHQKKAGHIFADCLQRCLISPSAVILRKDLFWQYGGFDEGLPACEDYDLWLKISLRQAVGLLPEALVIRYAGHRDQLSARYPVMDRFRIQALENILDEIQDPDLRNISLETLHKKCLIVANGSLKRGRLWQWWVYYQKQKKYRSRASMPT